MPAKIAQSPPNKENTDITTLPDTSIYARKDIPIEKLIDLKKKGLSYQQVADLAGCSKANALNRLKSVIDDIDNVECFKTHRADIFAVKQSKLINHINESTIKKMSVRDATVSIGILYDKERLERGQSTEIVDVRALHASLSELEAQERELRKIVGEEQPEVKEELSEELIDSGSAW